MHFVPPYRSAVVPIRVPPIDRFVLAMYTQFVPCFFRPSILDPRFRSSFRPSQKLGNYVLYCHLHRSALRCAATPTLSMLIGLTSGPCKLSTTLRPCRTTTRVHGQRSRPSQEPDRADWNAELVEYGGWTGWTACRTSYRRICITVRAGAATANLPCRDQYDYQGVHEEDHIEDYMRISEQVCSSPALFSDRFSLGTCIRER
jgi:hypothetical protein